MGNLSWQDDAKCLPMDVNFFFLPYRARGEDKKRRVAAAKAVCATCPVASECLEYALGNAEVYGVWGGKSEDERREMMLASGK